MPCFIHLLHTNTSLMRTIQQQTAIPIHHLLSERPLWPSGGLYIIPKHKSCYNHNPQQLLGWSNQHSRFWRRAPCILICLCSTHSSLGSGEEKERRGGMGWKKLWAWRKWLLYLDAEMWMSIKEISPFHSSTESCTVTLPLLSLSVMRLRSQTAATF